MAEPDKLAVAIIRTFNSHVVVRNSNDRDVYDMFGQAAQPLADALRETIREEVSRALREAAQDGVRSTP